MILKLDVKLHYRLSEPMDLLLQIEAADLVDQQVRSTEIWTSDVAHFSRVSADDGGCVWGNYLLAYRLGDGQVLTSGAGC